MDWEYWLNRKYANLEQQTAADATRANAGMLAAQSGANLDNVRAGLLPAESRANIALTGAQARQADANTAQTNEETRFIPERARAEIFATRQQGGLYGSEAAGNNILNRGFKIGSPFSFGGGMATPSSNPLLDYLRSNLRQDVNNLSGRN